MKKIIKIFAVVLMTCFFASPALAYYSLGEPNGFVNDYADVLSEPVENILESELVAFEQETGHEIAVVTIESLDDDYIENFAEKLFKEWGIGKKDADNGILFLLAVKDREARIEVGYGLEGALTDLQSSFILENVGKPYFIDEDFDSGISKSVAEIEKAIKGEDFEGRFATASAAVSQLSPWQKVLEVLKTLTFFAVFFLFGLFRVLAAWLGKSKSWWLGGVIGGGIGLIIGLIAGSILTTIFLVSVLTGIGFLVDWLASAKGWFKLKKGKDGGAKGVFFGPFRGGSSGGGGGGFGGGSSGGGGSSSSW